MWSGDMVCDESDCPYGGGGEGGGGSGGGSDGGGDWWDTF